MTQHENVSDVSVMPRDDSDSANFRTEPSGAIHWVPVPSYAAGGYGYAYQAICNPWAANANYGTDPKPTADATAQT